jgi:phospholipase/carboxylesterase
MWSVFLTLLIAVLPVVDRPVADPNAPIVIGLHGRGDTPENFSHVADGLGPQFHWQFPRGPLDFVAGNSGSPVHCYRAGPEHPRLQVFGGGPACWFDRQASDGGHAAIIAAMDLVATQVRAAGKRPVALVGFSQGCMLAAHYAAAHPDQIRAVLCFGGMLVDSIQVRPGKHAVQIRFIHGKNDQMVPFTKATEAVAILHKAGLDVTLTEHAGGHVIPPQLVPELRGWLADRLK